MVVRLSGSAMETTEMQLKKASSPMEVTPAGTTTWPFASAVYRQRGEQDQGVQIACTGSVAAPSASRSKIVDILSTAKPTRNLTDVDTATWGDYMYMHMHHTSAFAKPTCSGSLAR